MAEDLYLIINTPKVFEDSISSLGDEVTTAIPTLWDPV